MKKLCFIQLGVILSGIGLFSCNEKNDQNSLDQATSSYSYNVSVSLENNSGPELQSFAHANMGSNWLLFAGRTNYQQSDNGGLHNQNANNYSYSSFPLSSFNDSLFVYNVDTGVKKSRASSDLVNDLKAIWDLKAGTNTALLNDILSMMPAVTSMFNCTNPQITQDDTYMYFIGGYGPAAPGDTTYTTFGTVARINIALMIDYVNGNGPNTTNPDPIWYDLLRCGFSINMIATGGELYKLDEQLYLCGGHNFGASASSFQGQKYQDAVYGISMQTITEKPWRLGLGVDGPITDVSPITLLLELQSDNISKMRRRDGPMVPILYTDRNSNLRKGVAFYGGVFRPGNALAAWDFAIYITPYASAGMYTMDSVNRQSQNVYSCPDFGIYDPNNSKVYTFLPGGIGDGKKDGNLSPFTNGITQVTLDMSTMVSSYVSSPALFPFLNNDTTFFGAESAFFLTSSMSANTYKLPDGVDSELIDVSTAFGESNSIDVGYIYGGIEAKKASPGKGSGYGPGLSKATGKIWKVTLTRTAL